MAVSSERRAAHVALPIDLLQEVDVRAGPRRRSEFIQEAIEEKLNRLRRIEAFERAVATPTEGVPEWEMAESAAEWVRSLRQEWSADRRAARQSRDVDAQSLLKDADTKLRRVHVVMPENLIGAIDAFVGKRHRSQFIAETVAAELRRRRLRAALDEMAGSLADVDIPGWETPESAAEWVRALRRGEVLPVAADPDD